MVMKKCLSVMPLSILVMASATTLRAALRAALASVLSIKIAEYLWFWFWFCFVLGFVFFPL